jgi:hypothetical protein
MPPHNSAPRDRDALQTGSNTREVLIMLRRAVLVVPVLLAASAATAWANPVRRAGEWQTTMDGGQPLVACFPKDQTYDENTFTHAMSKLPGANCKTTNFSTSGDVISYSVECTIGGSLMTSSGVITATGPDSFTSKNHSHGGMVPMPNGKTMAMPDTDNVSVSRRLGPCKPGDREVKD